MDTHIRSESSMTVLEILPPGYNKQVANFPASNIADLRTDYHGPSPYHLNYCGTEKCAPGFQFGPSVRRSYLLHLVTAGHGTYTVGKKKYRLSPGEMFLIYPGDTTVYKADQRDPWTYYWIGFSGYQADYILSQMGYSKESHVITLSDTEVLAECISEMLLTHQINLANELTRGSLLLRFLALVLRQRPQKTSSTLHSGRDYAQLTMRYLTEHYSQKVRISKIADYIGVDRSHMCKCFREEYQMSPQECLIRLRMDRAAELLVRTQETVTQIAEQCGYPDSLAFTKMFRKSYQMSPTEYRERSTGRTE
ncbi:MAG: AraC family transcriptional regulator [Lachnospiraceae bacterium]|nr:AraC family transcriptional regulator [Lachnospiraceae bacterium]